MFSFTRIPLVRQFLLLSLLILLAGMTIIGYLVSAQIEDGVLNRTASLTALYVDSFISPEVQSLGRAEQLSDETLLALDQILKNTSLGEQIVSFKIWTADGRILYSPNRDLIGRVYGVDNDLAVAAGGGIISSISSLRKPEHEYERQYWDQLIETYAPIRESGSDRLLAVSEFYQLPDELMEEIRRSRLNTWLLVGGSTLGMYFLLIGLVRRASNTITYQQVQMDKQYARLGELFNQNQHLHARVARAGERTIILNEQYLNRLSADIHDGPGQDLALALMSVNNLRDDLGENLDPQLGVEPILAIHTTLNSANNELRKLASGIRLPELKDMTLQEVIEHSLRTFEGKTASTINRSIEIQSTDVPSPVKIAIYRVIQEALSNTFRHAGGKTPYVSFREDGSLIGEIIDTGNGFDVAALNFTEGLGLAIMRERIELLGGIFTIHSELGQGTEIRFTIPLNRRDKPEPSNDPDEIQATDTR